MDATGLSCSLKKAPGYAEELSARLIVDLMTAPSAGTQARCNDRRGVQQRQEEASSTRLSLNATGQNERYTVLLGVLPCGWAFLVRSLHPSIRGVTAAA